MSDKKNRLIERAKETIRQPKIAGSVSKDNAAPINTPAPKTAYKVIAVSLYLPEAQWVDQITRTLQIAGNPKANRSLVIREAILRLQEEMAGKDPKDILASFIEHHSKRMEKF